MAIEAGPKSEHPALRRRQRVGTHPEPDDDAPKAPLAGASQQPSPLSPHPASAARSSSGTRCAGARARARRARRSARRRCASGGGRGRCGRAPRGAARGHAAGRRARGQRRRGRDANGGSHDLGGGRNLDGRLGNLGGHLWRLHRRLQIRRLGQRRHRHAGHLRQLTGDTLDIDRAKRRGAEQRDYEPPAPVSSSHDRASGCGLIPRASSANVARMNYGARGAYEQPQLRDYGDLAELTASTDGVHGIALFGVAPTLSISSPSPSPGSGGVAGSGGSSAAPAADSGGVLPEVGTGGDQGGTLNNVGASPDSGGVAGSGDSGSSGSGSSPAGSAAGTGGGSAGGGGAGGHLAFTGFAAASAGSVGSAFVAAGAGLRRLARRR